MAKEKSKEKKDTTKEKKEKEKKEKKDTHFLKSEERVCHLFIHTRQEEYKKYLTTAR